MLTCTGVSFFHGSNDGQKGMGLIMLILIGTVPTAYAVNHAITEPRRRTSSPFDADGERRFHVFGPRPVDAVQSRNDSIHYRA